MAIQTKPSVVKEFYIISSPRISYNLNSTAKKVYHVAGNDNESEIME